MTTVITHLKGPLKGKVEKFPDHIDRIEIGRDDRREKNNNGNTGYIAFPTDFTAIGGRHCTLVRDATRFEIRVDTNYRVLLDGEKAIDGTELGQEAIITLGPAGDAELSFEQRREGNRPETIFQGQPEVDDAYLIVRSKRNVKRLAAVLGVAVLAIFFAWDRIFVVESTLQQKIREMSDKSVPDFQTAIENSQKSIYLVTLVNEDGKESPVGTAWVTQGGFLATNAHVAEAVRELISSDQSNLHALVRQGIDPFSEHKITGVRIHPAYQAFQDLWEEYNPLLVDAGGAAVEYEFLGGYDVALLEVDNTAALGPALTLAREDEMKELRRGYPIAFNGFPMENLVNFDPKKPISNSQIGIITAITDFFRTTSFDSRGELIQHSLPATGGASGSPIMNSNGHVVGILNAGNVVNDMFGGRSPSAANINFAQRVDLINQLFNPDQINLDELAASWRSKLAKFETKASLLNIEKIVHDWTQARNSDSEATEVTKLQLLIPAEENSRAGAAAVEQSVKLSNSGFYLIIAESKTERDIDMIVLDTTSGDSVDDPNVLGSDDATDHVPLVELDTDEPLTVSVYIVDAGLVVEAGEDHSIQSEADFRVYYLPYSE